MSFFSRLFTDPEVRGQLRSIRQQLTAMSNTLADLPAILDGIKTALAANAGSIKTQLARASTEILAELAKVQTNPDLPPAVVESLNTIAQLAGLAEAKAAAQTLDDIVPDAPPVEPQA